MFAQCIYTTISIKEVAFRFMHRNSIMNTASPKALMNRRECMEPVPAVISRFGSVFASTVGLLTYAWVS